MSKIIRVLLVDEHPIVRGGLSACLSPERDMSVVGEASDAFTAIRLAERLKPDIVLIETNLSGRSGFDVLRTIQAQENGPRGVILSASCRDADIEAALKTQVFGYIIKSAGIEIILRGIREVARGQVFYCDVVESRIVTRLTGRNSIRAAVSRASTLTQREVLVLRHLSLGRSVKEVAGMLKRSAKTIDNHKSNIMAKLDIHDRVELSRFAIREGIVNI